MNPIYDKIVVLGSDHNGVDLKKTVKEQLFGDGYFCIDVGPYSVDKKVDYVDYAMIVGKIIDNNEAKWGILICGTGVGMSMVANRLANVRASLVHNLETAHKSREHNNANVLCLGAWINSPEANLEIVRTWLNQSFGEGRHVPRVEKFSREGTNDRIIFTNGIFDIIHSGHIHLLKFAKSLGGKLVVGINSDRATKILKGESRPINDEQSRKAILDSLDCVDQVIIFDDINTVDIIKKLKPDVLVKGGEWTVREVRDRDKIPSEIEIKICPLIPGFSTTEIMKKVQERKISPEYNKEKYDKTATE